jgi:hypothetical protein
MNLFIYMYSKSRFKCVFCQRIVKARKVDRALRNVFCIVTLSIVIYVDNRGGSRNTPKFFAPRSAQILWQKTHLKRLFEYMYINKFIFQTKDYQLVFVAYNAKHTELRRKSKDWLLRNQDNVSEWSDMYIRGLLFPLANTI